MKYTYKEVTTFLFPDAVVRVYRPELTEEEREKRMRAIRKQTEIFLRNVKA